MPIRVHTHRKSGPPRRVRSALLISSSSDSKSNLLLDSSPERNADLDSLPIAAIGSILSGTNPWDLGQSGN